MSVALTGADTIIYQGRVFTDFGDGDVGTLAFDTDLVEVVNGKNDNAVYALNAKGKQGTLTLKLIRGSADDIFLNSQLVALTRDFPSYVLGNGNFSKRIGQGNGTVLTDSYLALGGVVGRTPDANSSSDGKTDDGQITYVIKFAKMVRVV
jgi:hypothetical protein